mmetsp:Transcript_6061/g.8655  ORF Transcript_6061/g.8655 Transcript_6061/m.8655 type:complete len:83 (+) Transcript_6061:413-661(+)
MQRSQLHTNPYSSNWFFRSLTFVSVRMYEMVNSDPGAMSVNATAESCAELLGNSILALGAQEWLHLATVVNKAMPCKEGHGA